jgi:hypothetical protein
VTAEIGPPRSASADLLLKKANALKGSADAFNLTDNQTAMSRMSSIACGVGAQTIQAMYPKVRALPGLNTSNMGAPVEPGIFMEKCGGCGDCVIHLTGGICPIVRCAKSLLNGPCGGSQNGKCEIGGDTPCAWEEIYQSLKELGRLDLLEANIPPKDWTPSRSGGPRKVVRPEAVMTETERQLRGER